MELAYSTDPNWCSRCRHLPCVCQAKPARPQSKAGSGVVKMRREMRRGKPVIVLFELPMNETEARDLLKAIQRTCGCGGAYKNQTVEIQGDHREAIERLLSERGFKARRAGG